MEILNDQLVLGKGEASRRCWVWVLRSFRRQKTVKIEGFQYGKVNRFDLRALFVDDMQTDYSGNSLNYHLCFRGKT
jgi:hypothetical protein